MFHVEQSLRLLGILRSRGVPFSDTQREAIDAYVQYLLEWNAKVNLVSRRDEENVWASHILHSLSPLFHISFPDRLNALDLGTGGGLPGIPLAIAQPDWRIVLLDSIRKKCTAVEDIVRRVGLERVTVATGRAEDPSVLATYGGQFDIVLARGIAPLAELVRWSRPYMRPDGGVIQVRGADGAIALPVLLAYKGGDLQLEEKGMMLKEGIAPSAVVPLVFGGDDDGVLQEKKIVVVEVPAVRGGKRQGRRT